jgi:dTDP-glucose 4,6-dehydratase
MGLHCNRTILVTGGAGFIGSNFVLACMQDSDDALVNLDLLTYAGNARNLDSIAGYARQLLVVGDVANRELVRALLAEHRPRAIVHFAAESHVDRSILDPEPFLHSNIAGTSHLLEETRAYWSRLSEADGRAFRFLHVSTDEVYGSLSFTDPPFSEASRYAPNSPYAASKAASDHLVRACHHTFGMPVLTAICSNNYGPRQFPEKLIPLMLLNALAGQALPVYGDGSNVRDWIYVEDCCRAIRSVLTNGIPGQVYNIGGHNERSNLQVVHTLCDLLDQLMPPTHSYRGLIRFVGDRPGHDLRYALDTRKIEGAMGWLPSVPMEEGLRRTVRWYLENMDWVENVRTGAYTQWLHANYDSRKATDVERG